MKNESLSSKQSEKEDGETYTYLRFILR